MFSLVRSMHVWIFLRTSGTSWDPQAIFSEWTPKQWGWSLVGQPMSNFTYVPGWTGTCPFWCGFLLALGLVTLLRRTGDKAKTVDEGVVDYWAPTSPSDLSGDLSPFKWTQLTFTFRLSSQCEVKLTVNFKLDVVSVYMIFGLRTLPALSKRSCASIRDERLKIFKESLTSKQ